MKRSLPGMISLALALLFTALACAPGRESAAPPAAAPGTAERPGATKPAWEQEWDRVLAAGKQEGRVSMYTTQGAEFRTAVAAVMAKKYSIELESLTGRTDEISERVMREQRSKVYNADVLIAISTSNFDLYKREALLQPLEQALILPDVADPKTWYRNQLTWLDVEPGEKTVLGYRESVAPPMVINTQLVKPGELKSWDDLLNPKWKGKILLQDPTGGGGGQLQMIMLVYGIKNWDFVKALVKQEPELHRDNRLMAEWVARGKFPIVIGPQKAEVFQFMKAGAPLEYLTPSEGTYSSVGAGTVALVKNSQHPNAARVLINFLLTKEGQTIAAETSGNQSLRLDVPVDSLDTDTVRQPGIKYISNTDKGFREKESEIKAEVVRIFQAYLKGKG
ncbi:MAG: extracellular solute-binding protein [Chloroflexi bacterium]|nr:extracellular solute-binding protein [Chloroflexota bacterium]